MAARKPAAPTRRVNRGKGHSYLLDGKPCDGVTTLIGAALAKPALVTWAAKSVAEYVSRNRSILTDLEDDAVVDLLKGVPFRDRDKAANRGTEVQALAAKLSMGEEVDVPEELLGHVDAYVAFLHEWEPQDSIVERTVVSRRYRYAGTFDMICTLPGLGRTMVDVKTNRSGPFGEVALQLVAYSHAEVMLDDAGNEEPVPTCESHAALWLHAEGYELIPYDVGEREWRTFLYCAELARWVWDRTDFKKATNPVKGYALAFPERVTA